jgi:hypothetical protein
VRIPYSITRGTNARRCRHGAAWTLGALPASYATRSSPVDTSQELAEVAVIAADRPLDHAAEQRSAEPIDA